MTREDVRVTVVVKITMDLNRVRDRRDALEQVAAICIEDPAIIGNLILSDPIAVDIVDRNRETYLDYNTKRNG